ncbi:MAG: methyltransferase domain-containing protein, partial [Longimicrobiales bacterium]
MSDEIRTTVKKRYGKAALAVIQGAPGDCGCGCGPGTSGKDTDPITRDLYDQVTTDTLPEQAVLASLGCGNPTALAELREGEVVLDLGSGGGIDVLLSARKVGPTGKAYGVDMTDEMLTLARKNAAAAGAGNV